ncbi:MAG: peptidoglycan-binding protein, partial [Dichotomicrobium sp.]
MRQSSGKKQHSQDVGLSHAYRASLSRDIRQARNAEPCQLDEGVVRPKDFGFVASVLITAFILLVFAITTARAQDDVLMPGDAVVTGFSGIKPADVPLAPGGSPLDEFFIDLDGSSAQIMSLAVPGAPPEGQLVYAPTKLQVKARDVGQVFATALDDRGAEPTPDIYLGATSAYGLHIVLPDSDGDGAPERVRNGHPNAEWMPGMFATDAGGSPGAIWRVDGETGEVALFATLPDNSGPGVGDVVFDSGNDQFFASDLDNGLIYRIAADGTVIGSFDHGLDGRPARGLPGVADDGAVADITSPDFDIEDPGTWGYTQDARMVWGMAVHGGRLYYAVAEGPEIWSVGLAEDGGFLDDARWEFTVDGAAHPSAVTDMVFDGQGRLVLAQRGSPRGSYDYSVFAEPAKAESLRYRREDPDDPATESVWVQDDPERYAIGMPPEHLQAEGGVALGYGHDESGTLDFGACNVMLWSTGHRLRPSAEGADMTDPDEADIHGLQGNALALARPDNVPPSQSYFADYDGFAGDAAKAGHIGDVEIWQPCEDVSEPDYGYLPPGYLPPLDNPPDDFPGDWPGDDPEPDYETNLELTKYASPGDCWEWGGGWLCRYRVHVTNTGPDDYLGPILVDDWLPAVPPGAVMGFAPSPPWSCWSVGASDYRCFRPGVFLVPGASVTLSAYAWVPEAYDKCHLRNEAEIAWAPGGTPWNIDPFDDFDGAGAFIPSEDCLPDDDRTDLEIYKRDLMDCYEAGGGVRCAYRVTVVNNGPGNYNGTIVVEDQPPVDASGATFSGAGWSCLGPSGTGSYYCSYPGASLSVGDALSFIVRVDLSREEAREAGCRVRNAARITEAPGGSEKNFNPTNDTDAAVATVPDELCLDQRESNLKLEKRVADEACLVHPGNDWCRLYNIRITNTGPDTFNGNITVQDLAPAGLDVFLSAPAGWSCVGATCKTDAPVTLTRNPPTADEAVVKVAVQGTQAQAKELGCELTNRARIVSPLGPNKNLHAGDDQDLVSGPLPEQFCEEDNTNLLVTKDAQSSTCEPADGGYECVWEITVRNDGPGVHSGPIQLDETLPAEPEDASFNAPWTCQGVGGGPEAVCDHPAVELQPGEELGLLLKTVFGDDAFSGPDCSLTNGVEIATPAGGTPGNTEAGDDSAEATAALSEDVCQRTADAHPCPPGYQWTGQRCARGTTGEEPGEPSEEPDLALFKSANAQQCREGEACGFTIRVENAGDAAFTGRLDFTDRLSSSAGLRAAGPGSLSCSGQSSSYACTHPEVTLAPGASRRFTMSFTPRRGGSLRNCVSLAWGAGQNEGRVVAVQKALNARGFDAGPEDNVFGSQTASGIRAYQRENDLEETGRIDDLLLANLFGTGDSNARNDRACASVTVQEAPRPQPDPQPQPRPRPQPEQECPQGMVG